MSELRMSAYHYEFTPTGVREIDEILSAVAWAGKAYHNTEDWDKDCPNYGLSKQAGNGITAVEWIQNAANRAALKFKEN